MKSSSFFSFLVLSFSIINLHAAELKAAHLTCENFTNPIGIDSPKPRFSWQLTSDARSVTQSAYRILIADNQKDLSINIGRVWDSKKQYSDQSILLKYDGKPLMSAKKYYWKVMTWDGKGVASVWSDVASWQMGLLIASDWKNARWIGYEDIADSMCISAPAAETEKMLGEKAKKVPVVPLLRKEFRLNKKIASATLFITGVGQYEASINGEKIGNGFLTPGWTNYDKTVLYNSYDVTKKLKIGINAIGAVVGNGFYYIPRERYRKLVVAYGMPKMICRLIINYNDGTQENIVSDSNWKTTPSPITFSSIYGGEDFDARLEQTNWKQAEFDATKWKSVVMVSAPKGQLKAECDYPVTVAETFCAKKIEKVGEAKYLYDFGQNASGVLEIKVNGKKGQIIKITPCEFINEDKSVNQKASGSKYYYSYTLKGGGVETWRPQFTYYGFRYAMVEGAEPDTVSIKSNLPALIALTHCHTRNSTPNNGSFHCSNQLFNSTYDLINWAIKSNMQSILTDCPHREKLGWLEQTFLMGNSINYNFDIYHLYQKVENDMMDARLANGFVPNIVPEYVAFDQWLDGAFRDSPEWGSASVILPWLIYNWYGDKLVMEKAWPMMVQYVEYLERKSNNHILAYGLGDWYDLGPRNPGVSQLTPLGVTSTAIYYYDLKLLAQMAKVLNKNDEIKRFTVWSEKVKNAFNTKYLNVETGVYSTGSQTAMAMPLSFGIVDEKMKDKVVKNLVDSIIADNKALTAGDIGFHYLVESLVKNNQSQLLFDMNNRDDVPGYGYQLKHGATSLTESWMANKISSNNHLMLGHLMQWFYEGLGGIQQQESSVAYKNLIIKPTVVGDITSTTANFETPYGQVKTDWKMGNKVFNLKVSIPANSSALVYLPIVGNSLVTESGSSQEQSDYKLVDKNKECIILKVGSGYYDFEVK
jgi:hypothetical protein